MQEAEAKAASSKTINCQISFYFILQKFELSLVIIDLQAICKLFNLQIRLTNDKLRCKKMDCDDEEDKFCHFTLFVFKS